MGGFGARLAGLWGILAMEAHICVCSPCSWVLVVYKALRCWKCPALVVVVRLRAVGIHLINCIPVLHNQDGEADGVCSVPSCSFRVGGLGVCSVQAGMLTNPLSR